MNHEEGSKTKATKQRLENKGNELFSSLLCLLFGDKTNAEQKQNKAEQSRTKAEYRQNNTDKRQKGQR